MPYRAFVSNDGSNQIQVVELSTGDEAARIPVPPGPFGLALTPDHLQLWVPLDVARSVAVICTPTSSVMRQIALHDPHLTDVAIAHDGSRAYVLSALGVIHVIDVRTNDVKALWGIGGVNTERMELSPDGTELWVVDEGQDTVIVVDTARGRTVRHVTDAHAPSDLAFTPDGRKVYISDMATGSVLAVDRASREVLREIRTEWPEGLPRAVAVNPDGREVYVTFFGADQVAVIGTESDEVIGVLEGPFDGPNGIGLTPDGRTAVIVNQHGDFTTVADIETRRQVGTLPFHGNPRRVVVGEVPAFEHATRAERSDAQ